MPTDRATSDGQRGGRLRIGLALGSGSARGWAHIGVIHALRDAGIEPDIVCGCSAGAIVGAAHAAGHLEDLESWVRSLTWRDVAGFLRLKLDLNGIIDGPRLRHFLARHVCEDGLPIASLALPFGAVATSLERGREVWLTEGPALEAVWASMSLPGLFPPIRYRGEWLVDGGLVNPVPVSLARAMGADAVIAVNLNGDILGRRQARRRDAAQAASGGLFEVVSDRVLRYSSSLFSGRDDGEQTPSFLDAMMGSINIMADRITRSRLAGDPPEVLLQPRLGHIGLLEFHRAAEAIAEGRSAVERVLPEIRATLADMGDW